MCLSRQRSNFRGVDDLANFLTSGERQQIVLHLLNSLRADDGDEVDGIKFREGEAIGESVRLFL